MENEDRYKPKNGGKNMKKKSMLASKTIWFGGVLPVTFGIIGYLIGSLDSGSAGTSIWAGLTVIFMRLGINK